MTSMANSALPAYNAHGDVLQARLCKGRHNKLENGCVSQNGLCITRDFCVNEHFSREPKAGKAVDVPRRKQYLAAQPSNAPSPTKLYLAQARLPVLHSEIPQRLLVVLDLNGTLLIRKNRKNSQGFNVRPGAQALLRYVIDHHVPMIYSSACPENVRAMVNNLLVPVDRKALAAVWGRDKLDLSSAQFSRKVQVYKKLQKIWNDKDIQALSCEQQPWGQHNTVLVDDDHQKAATQPHNLVHIPSYIKSQSLGDAERKQESEVIWEVKARLEELKWSRDVSRHIFRWQKGESIEPCAPAAPGKGASQEIFHPTHVPPASISDSQGEKVNATRENIRGTQALRTNLPQKLTTVSPAPAVDHVSDLSVPAEERRDVLH